MHAHHADLEHGQYRQGGVGDKGFVGGVPDVGEFTGLGDNQRFIFDVVGDDVQGVGVVVFGDVNGRGAVVEVRGGQAHGVAVEFDNHVRRVVLLCAASGDDGDGLVEGGGVDVNRLGGCAVAV